MNAEDHLTDTEFGRLMRQLSPEDRRRVRRAGRGRATVDEPRLAALAAEQAHRNVKSSRTQIIIALLLMPGPISRLVSANPVFGRPLADRVLLVMLLAMMVASAAAWRLGRRAQGQYGSAADLAALRAANLQPDGDARAFGRAEVRRRWEQRLRERSSPDDA